LAHPSFVSQQYNPSCGDAVSVMGCIDSAQVICTIKFNATGCVISVAAASLLSEIVLAEPFLVSATSLDHKKLLEKIGIPLGPTRIKCALLPFYALKDCLTEYQIK
jgi:nitrogen fixation NifU-like protein